MTKWTKVWIGVCRAGTGISVTLEGGEELSVHIDSVGGEKRVAELAAELRKLLVGTEAHCAALAKRLVAAVDELATLAAGFERPTVWERKDLVLNGR